MLILVPPERRDPDKGGDYETGKEVNPTVVLPSRFFSREASHRYRLLPSRVTQLIERIQYFGLTNTDQLGI